MDLFTRAATGIKAFALRFAGGSAAWWPWSGSALGRSRFDYAAEVGTGLGNSAVVATILWICRTFPEAPLRIVRDQPDGTAKVMTEHRMTRLLARPNPFYSGPLLWMATLVDWTATGNAYWFKARNSSSGIAELWYLPQQTMTPKYPADGSVFISHYEYRPGGQGASFVNVEVDDVVHFRYGLDPNNTRLGMSPLASVLREVFTDDEAAHFTGTLLRNLGVPGVVISPDDDKGKFNQEQAEALKANWQQKLSLIHI